VRTDSRAPEEAERFPRKNIMKNKPPARVPLRPLIARPRTGSPPTENVFSEAESVFPEGAAAPMTFPEDLLRPTPSQLELAQDEVTRVVEQLDERARHYGTKLGVSMTNFELSEVSDTITRSENWQVLLIAMTRNQEFISLEKRDGRWGLWHTRTPPPLASAGRSVTTVPLRDAPLEARMKFLHKSEQFFREYLERVKQGLGSPQQAAERGKLTLALLDSIKPL
jgi:hypothetical protein